MDIPTTPKHTYAIASAAGCTVSVYAADDETLIQVRQVNAGAQASVVAYGSRISVSDPHALVTEVFNAAPASDDNGGGGTPLSPVEQEAVTNATVGVLEDVTYEPTPAVAATGWIHTEYTSALGGRQVLKAVINGVEIDQVGTIDTLAAFIEANEETGVLAVGDGEYIRLTARVAGASGNNITLSSSAPSWTQVSGDTLTGGKDAGVPISTKLTVNENGISITNFPAGSVLNTGGLPIDTIGGNVYHRNGSATFVGQVGGQDKTTAVMSGNGFIVYHGSASDSSPVIFRVSADASVDPFISMADADGNEKIRISADANNPSIKVDGARVLTEDGERVLTASVSGTTASVTMHHATVVEVPSNVTAVIVSPNAKTGYSKQTHLILTPAATMPGGWLTAAEGAVVRWPFGELAMPSGWSYIVTLVQVGKVILANALPVDLSTPSF